MVSRAQAIKTEDGAIRVETGWSLETVGEGIRESIVIHMCEGVGKAWFFVWQP